MRILIGRDWRALPTWLDYWVEQAQLVAGTNKAAAAAGVSGSGSTTSKLLPNPCTGGLCSSTRFSLAEILVLDWQLRLRHTMVHVCLAHTHLHYIVIMEQ